MHTKFYSENRKERDYLGDIGVDRRIILKCILKIGNVIVDRIHLTQDS
jgi:hypothetical protein